jgi:hypothetical protein
MASSMMTPATKYRNGAPNPEASFSVTLGHIGGPLQKPLRKPAPGQNMLQMLVNKHKFFILKIPGTNYVQAVIYLEAVIGFQR